jgi:two-component system KDP operon response regulator KdpE
MTAGAHVLLVEDDEPVRRGLAANLAAHGYVVDEAAGVREALQRWDARRPDVILLDLGLPDGDGSAVIRRVRREATTPILILSARGDEADKVAALDAGADDYVTKPFGLAELRSRVAAILRRAAGPSADPTGSIRHGPLLLDADEGHYLHVYMSRLRHKLAAADPGGAIRDLIVAEPGVGYRVAERPDPIVD